MKKYAQDPRGQVRRRVWRAVPFVLVSAIAVVGVAVVSFVPVSGAGGCQVTNAAFCDTFDQGPSAVRGRGGDLDPAKWGAARLAPSDFSGSVANPTRAATMPACRASLPISSAYPSDDTLICDASGNKSSQLLTAVAIQNYGVNSYMVRQPFDFTARTGKIVFDVDATSQGTTSTWVNVDITSDPVPAPTFREYENYEVGPLPRNGLMMKWGEICGDGGNKITLANVLYYRDYVPTTVTPTFSVNGQSCARTQAGSLNHFEIRVSQTTLEIWASDFSTDNGNTFPNFRKIYAGNINLNFSRGYVHFAARNHATSKYGYGTSWAYHWDNIGFDGPVVTPPRAYEVPNNNTSTTHDGAAMRNLGWQLQDGSVNGKPAGMYDPSNRISPFSIPGVDLTAVSTAKVTFNVFFNTIGHTATTSWGLNYKFNGGTQRQRMLSAMEVGAINGAGSAGNLTLVIDVPLSDIRAGTNTLEFTPIASPMDYPPAIANIDLVLGLTTGPVPTAPANLRIIQ